MPSPKKKSAIKLKEPVRLRTKKLANGNESIYLDIYVDGKRQYEFLKLYLLPEVSEKVKEQNRATLAAAETIKSHRIIELANDKAGLKKVGVRSKVLLVDWLQTYIEAQERRGVRGLKLLTSTKRLLEIFSPKTRMCDIDKRWCLKFLDWIQHTYKTAQGTQLAAKSAADYVGYLSTALNSAVRGEVISENPFMNLDSTERIKVPESQRQFLSKEEIEKLVVTDAPREDVKRAYLFACYCGLRISDVYALKWSDIIKDGDKYKIQIVMHKTATPIYLPMSQRALDMLPEKSETHDVIFWTLPAEPNINKNLRKWMKAAGITKHISFHTSRHTFATSLLTAGADLFVTSKMLGHSDVKTTQIYAKIVDEKKMEAMNMLDKLYGAGNQ